MGLVAPLNPANLSAEDRKAYLLARAYEEARRTRHGGYRAFEDLTPELLNTPTWKTFRTVALWLEGKGWDLSLAHVHWTGYIKHVFAKLETSPMPGQLRNDMLVKDYLRTNPIMQGTRKTEEQLDALYKRVLAPEVSALPAARKWLHLETA